MTDSPESEYESESGDEAVDEPMSRERGFYTIGRSKFGALCNYPWNAPGVISDRTTGLFWAARMNMQCVVETTRSY